MRSFIVLGLLVFASAIHAQYHYVADSQDDGSFDFQIDPTTSLTAIPLPTTTDIVPTITPSPSTTQFVPVTTPAVQPTTPSSPSLEYKVMDNKTVCIEMKGHVDVSVTYNTHNNKTATKKFPLPQDGIPTGTCATKGMDSMAVLVVTFKQMVFTWEFDVKKDNSWSSKSMKLEITLKNNKMFPDASDDTLVAKSENKSDVTTIKASAAMSYTCPSSRSYPLGKSVIMDFKDVQVQPFREDKNTFAKAEVCSTVKPKKKTSNIVPIAVGCALAGLIVIVLIAYLIGRRKSSRGYQQV